MDKHKRLHELVVRFGKPANVFQAIDGLWYFDDGERAQCDKSVAHALIEHAARLHYEAWGYSFWRMPNGKYQAGTNDEAWECKPRPLIDALLAAAEHAAEGGEGEE